MTPGTDQPLPTVSPRLFRLFAAYSRWYLKRHFHAVRRSGGVPRVGEGAVVVYFNHPSWWDPMLAIFLANRLFADHTHHGPIDATALDRYAFFRKLGFFGAEPGVAGARRFLRLAEGLLERPGTMLWMTPEGAFSDPRRRPVRLRPGLARLARRLARGGGEAVLLPVALEYPFWEEKYPEALLRFGEPVAVGEVGAGTPEEWDRLLASRLEAAQDRLAAAAMERDGAEFDTLLGGRAGVGGVYEVWGRVKAAVRGEEFRAEHGAVVRRGPKRGAGTGDGDGPDGEER